MSNICWLQLLNCWDLLLFFVFNDSKLFGCWKLFEANSGTKPFILLIVKTISRWTDDKNNPYFIRKSLQRLKAQNSTSCILKSLCWTSVLCWKLLLLRGTRAHEHSHILWTVVENQTRVLHKETTATLLFITNALLGKQCSKTLRKIKSFYFSSAANPRPWSWSTAVLFTLPKLKTDCVLIASFFFLVLTCRT